MTTREFIPRLDRQITYTVTETVLAPTLLSYTWGTEYTGSGNPSNQGWRRDSNTRLTLALVTTSGGDFPTDLEAPIDGAGVSWDGAAASTLGITAIDVVRDPFTFRPLAVILDFDGDLPASGTTHEVSIPGTDQMEVTQTREAKLWAGRRDFTGRDFSTVVEGSLITIRDTRYIVRAESGPWAARDTFKDENGVTLNVQGVQQIGRQYLELLVRSGGL